MISSPPPADAGTEPYTTIEVAQLLGLAVRSVQLMVDRGELDAWKTPGGHRRISRASVERWLAARQGGHPGAHTRQAGWWPRHAAQRRRGCC